METSPVTTIARIHTLSQAHNGQRLPNHPLRAVGPALSRFAVSPTGRFATGAAAGAGEFAATGSWLGAAGTGALTGYSVVAGRLCSFSGDTRVLLADGSTKPIDELKVGDRVTAGDPETGGVSEEAVSHVWVHEDALNTLRVGDGRLATTEDHPYWSVTDRQWKRADQLERDELLLTPSGKSVQTQGLSKGSVFVGPAYNLTVDRTHTYYVLAGNTPVLVHNTGGCIPALRNWQSERFQFGNQQLLLDKKGMEHILTRHHPAHWDGSVKAQQSFFDRSMSVEDVQGAIGSVMRQNRDTLARRGGRGMYQVQGNVNGVNYVLGVNNGRVGQFYPLPGN
ncbi:polymorphic toxin-type HINT domain-containing protein [Micromonospora sp. DT62]|uniref:polymorphic toxin-type HINT domain-containing protein n=1 Tax=Micromonospora sp. DT62 TaxID=3416521 RepID=UPI003CF87CE7